MKKIIKLTESELNRIIRKVISEQQYAKRFDQEATEQTLRTSNLQNPEEYQDQIPMSKGYQDLGSASFEDRKPAYAKPKAPPAKTTGVMAPTILQKGSRGPEVAKYQLAMLNHGLSIGGSKTPDGIFGPTTEHSIKVFQSKNGLPVTGKIDPATGDLLLQKMNAKNTGGKLLNKLGDATKLPPPIAQKPGELNKPLPPEWARDNRETWADPNAGKTTQPKLAGNNSNNMGGGGGWLTKKLSNKG
jgi:peptidoglycan hydrolase-like protein with peptidoglycan-binding domain